LSERKDKNKKSRIINRAHPEFDKLRLFIAGGQASPEQTAKTTLSVNSKQPMKSIAVSTILVTLESRSCFCFLFRKKDSENNNNTKGLFGKPRLD